MWRRKNLTYDICIPPLSKPIAAFNSDDARDYFDWYMAKIPERIRYLSELCAIDLRIDKDEIGLRPDSLVLIWKWFLGTAKTEDSESNGVKLDLQTEYIIRDIGMFMGELFNANHKCINWSYYDSPKTDFFVNRPLLVGFRDNRFFSTV